MQIVGVESHVGIVREEERSARANTYVELDSVIGVAVCVVVTIGAAGPAGTVVERGLRLSGPAGIIEIGRHGVSGRSDGEQISDHHFVESYEWMVNLPRPLGRPVPIQEIAL